MRAAHYHRSNQNWSDWLGKVGTVMASTVIRVASPQYSHQVPYSYVIVEIDQQRHEFMGAGQELLNVGDKVVCVLRKEALSTPEGIIDYGIKVTRIQDQT